MYEWVLVTMVGAAGGVFPSLFTGGLRLPRKHEIDGRLRYDGGTVSDAAIGAAAGFVFWATYSQGVSFGAEAVSPPRVAASFLAGIGGERVLRAYVERVVTKEALQNLGPALRHTGQEETTEVSTALTVAESLPGAADIGTAAEISRSPDDGTGGSGADARPISGARAATLRRVQKRRAHPPR